VMAFDSFPVVAVCLDNSVYGQIEGKNQ